MWNGSMAKALTLAGVAMALLSLAMLMAWKMWPALLVPGGLILAALALAACRFARGALREQDEVLQPTVLAEGIAAFAWLMWLAFPLALNLLGQFVASTVCLASALALLV